MAFIASTITLQVGFEQLRSVALQQKSYLANWNTRLNSSITALDGLEIVASINRALVSLDANAALPGMQSFAQQQYGNPAYDVAAEFTAMRNALLAVRNWLTTNIPSNAVTIVEGAQVGAVYQPAATASLKSLVNAAAAKIA